MGASIHPVRRKISFLSIWEWKKSQITIWWGGLDKGVRRKNGENCSNWYRLSVSLEDKGTIVTVGLTFRSTRTASPSVNLGISLPFIPAHFSPWIFKRHLPSQAFIRWVFGVRSGFACMECLDFKNFGFLLLVQQALVTLIFLVFSCAVTFFFVPWV